MAKAQKGRNLSQPPFWFKTRSRRLTFDAARIERETVTDPRAGSHGEGLRGATGLITRSASLIRTNTEHNQQRRVVDKRL
jgi:hypothetical protein